MQHIYLNHNPEFLNVRVKSVYRRPRSKTVVTLAWHLGSEAERSGAISS